jgi:hypothetical protein
MIGSSLLVRLSKVIPVSFDSARRALLNTGGLTRCATAFDPRRLVRNQVDEIDCMDVSSQPPDYGWPVRASIR